MVAADGRTVAALADVLAACGPVTAEREFRHRPTEPFDPETGQGNGHVQYSFCAHRAVVEAADVLRPPCHLR